MSAVDVVEDTLLEPQPANIIQADTAKIMRTKLVRVNI